jgi:lysophospholipase L1-like esterase
MKNLLFGAVATSLTLLGLEAIARIAKTVEEDVQKASRGAVGPRWSIPSRTLGWERMPGYEGRIGDYDRELDADGYLTIDSSQVAGGSGKRVVFVGDSNTFGTHAKADATFVEVVDRLLPDVAAINLGVPGYTSHQGKLVLDRYLPRLKPDLVVVSFNFNDRRYVMPGQPVDGPERLRMVYTSASADARARALAPLEGSYLFRAFRRVAQIAGLVPRPPAVDRGVRVDQLRPRVDEASYRKNLESIVARTRARGIALIFLLLKDDPIRSHHLRQGIAQLPTSRATAMAHLSSAVRSGEPGSDLARLHLARSYRAQGETKRAEEVLVSKARLDLDGGWPIRLDVEYNEIMRLVALEHGVEVVDGGAAVDERPTDYVDFCHFNAAGHRRVGELLAGRIDRILSGAERPRAQLE